MLSNIANEFNTPEANREISLMPNVRVFYEKAGRAKYISHLDITRCMQRCLKRAAVPVWYTQGFNPHMYMTFALPLALGYESSCEAMDLRLLHDVDFDEMKLALNSALPRDIRVKFIAPQQNKPQSIAKALYSITFVLTEASTADDKDSVLQKLAHDFDEFCSQPKITVMKRTKKGAKPVDLKPEFEILSHSTLDGNLVYSITTTAGQKNINPTLLTDLYLEKSSAQNISVKVFRKQIFMENGEAFC